MTQLDGRRSELWSRISTRVADMRQLLESTRDDALATRCDGEGLVDSPGRLPRFARPASAGELGPACPRRRRTDGVRLGAHPFTQRADRAVIGVRGAVPLRAL